MVTRTTVHGSHTQKASPKGLQIIAEASQVQDHAAMQPTISGSISSPVKHEDLWTCRHCGWTYPNAHPSAKHRRNHKKNCGKRKTAKECSKSPSNASNDSSSEEEGHVGSDMLISKLTECDNHEDLGQSLNDIPSEKDSCLTSKEMGHLEGDAAVGSQIFSVEGSLKALNGVLTLQPQEDIKSAKSAEEVTDITKVVGTEDICLQTIVEEPLPPIITCIAQENDNTSVPKPVIKLGQDYKSETGDEALPSHESMEDNQTRVTESSTVPETLEKVKTCDFDEIKSASASTDRAGDPGSKQQVGELFGKDSKESLQEGNQRLLPAAVTAAVIDEGIAHYTFGEELLQKTERSLETKAGFEDKIDEDGKSSLPENCQLRTLEEIHTPQLWEQLLDAELERIKPKQPGGPALHEVLHANANEVQGSELGMAENNLPSVQQEGSHALQPMLPSGSFVESNGEKSSTEIMIEVVKQDDFNSALIQNAEPSSQSLSSNAITLGQDQNIDKASGTGSSAIEISHWANFEPSETPGKTQCSYDVKAEEPKQVPSTHICPVEMEAVTVVDQVDASDKGRPSLQVLFSDDLKVNRDQSEQEGTPSTIHSSPSSKGTPFLKRVFGKVLNAPPDMSTTLVKEKPKAKSKWPLFICCSAVN